MKLPPPIVGMLEDVETDSRVLPPTALYNEGWMLRLVLHSAARGIDCLPFQIARGARWFSEPSLYTAFAATSRSDKQAEKHTRADGAVGHFDFKPGTKTGLVLRSDATQFVVLEAKIGSRLSAGTTNATTFNQAARNVACIAYAISQVGRSPEQIQCGFHVVAPGPAIAAGAYQGALQRDSLLAAIDSRIQRYSGERRAQLEQWRHAWVEPTLRGLQIGCWSWEESLQRIEEADAALGNVAPARSRDSSSTASSAITATKRGSLWPSRLGVASGMDAARWPGHRKISRSLEART